MGYSGLKTWGDGDDAAGLVAEHVQHLVKVVKRGLKEKGNEVNPSGAVNVALMNESFILPVAKQLSLADYDDQLWNALLLVRGYLAGEIDDLKHTPSEEWAGSGRRTASQNRRWHLTAYNRMLKHMDETLHTLEHYPDKWMKAQQAKWKRKKKA